jgi:hypothetical protein
MGVTPAGAQPPPASDEVMLRLTQQEMEEDAAGRTGKAHAEAMAKQFGVPAKMVEDLRGTKQGWGEIGIRLGVAQELMKSDPKMFRTMNDSLVRVGDLRSQGKGWGKIAQQLGFNLGPVVKEVQRVRQEMRAEAKKAATAGVNKPDQNREQVRPESGRTSSKAVGGDPGQSKEQERAVK